MYQHTPQPGGQRKTVEGKWVTFYVVGETSCHGTPSKYVTFVSICQENIEIMGVSSASVASPFLCF